MSNLLRNFNLDSLSFWLGFVFATLLWWLLNRQRPLIRRFLESLLKQLQEIRRKFVADIETKHRQLTLLHAQGLHISSSIFGLNEILITPRFLAPPPFIEPGDEPPYQDITKLCVPYMPDWPELGTVYRAHTVTLFQALQGGANLVLIGRPGSGKTIALANLASQVARHDPATGDLQNHFPIMIRAADLDLPQQEPSSTLDTLIYPLLNNFPSLPASKYPDFARAVFEDGRVLLLLDGMDELAPSQVDETVTFLKQLLTEYPKTRIVTAASVEYFDGLTPLGFFPMPMVYWGKEEQAQFLHKWRSKWDEYLEIDPQQNHDVDSILLDSWLLNQEEALTPLEFTLRVWAAYAGDVIGPKESNAIESYLNRITANDRRSRFILEQIALHSILNRKSKFTQNDAQKWLDSIDIQTQTDNSPLQGQSQNGHKVEESIISTYSIKDLIDNGDLLIQTGDRLSFVHPMIAGYLASKAARNVEDRNQLLKQPSWSYQYIAIHFLAPLISPDEKFKNYFEGHLDPLHRSLLTTGKWLREIPRDTPLRAKILQRLTNTIRNEELSFDVRTRALTCLCVINDPEIHPLFRRWLGSKSPVLRQLAALGCGYVRDSQAIKNLPTLFHDLPSVSSSACLALVNIGTKKALDAVATALLEGSDELRIQAAEALANHPEEGHSLLKEGRNIEDLLVRRSIVFGLRQVRKPWAVDMLESIQIEDEEWVVRAAAEQMQEALSQPDPHIPHPLSPLGDTPWLIAFAGDRGMGVSPGEPARKMLLTAFREGDDQQRLAAMHHIRQLGEMDIFPTIYHLISGNDQDLSNAASHTLWHLSSMGINIPPPAQFDLA